MGSTPFTPAGETGLGREQIPGVCVKWILADRDLCLALGGRIPGVKDGGDANPQVLKFPRPAKKG